MLPHEPDIDDWVSLVIRTIQERVRKESYQILQGTWLNAEAEDADLSAVEIEGVLVRWARKAEHVTGLSAGDQVLCIKGPGVPVTIIAVVVGDVTLAYVE